MKLSPEAKQAIKTTIEQLRLLLVDDAMDTVREEVGKHLMDDEKGDDGKITISGDCRIEGKLSAGDIEIEGDGNKQVVLEAPELEVSGSNPFEEIQAEIKQLEAKVEQLARQTSCVESELTQQKAISERLSVNLLSYGAYRE
ncbi:TPA: hypothetical protein G5T75_003396 [Salmonella enterica]|uniref:Uncharacterized protein n=1 Tax=Salmonella enterica TaxID=28901 RepID=A0A754B5J1_SALER|nr:hypothetical protein [Salmonella enterica]ECU9162064.1 hypothetical protein [Salmonella enterica subsp. enterica serovar Newport str. CFSAN000599]EDU1194307.1 hypothetical protein [Salmonella enterica subsp. enterica serovar Heidelberg str. CFSAN000576]HAF8579452.1 hypothetical protein [Salmonella enterica]